MRIKVVFAAALLLVAASAADARITKIRIVTKESPAFGGYAFKDVGQYEKLVGKAYGELDPNDPKNSVIVDIKLAPTFLLPRGYTMVWSGWDASAGTDDGNYNTTITLPVAKNPDGSAITGPSYEYIVSGAAAYELNYPAATLDQSKAKLTHRVRLDDVPQVVPASGWAYDAEGTSIHLLPQGTRFTQGDIYELSYTAKDPTVNGVGFAAVRDFNAFLRYEQADEDGTRNPLAGDITRIYTEISSQPGRMLNDFRTFGFNQAENGKIVFDGMLQWIAAADGINMNSRFSQPGRTERNRQDQLYAEGVFPFANQRLKDPISGKTAGRYDACTKTNTCPLAMEIYSANEYWVKGASLFHTDPMGKMDLPDHPMARLYFVSSMQHGTGNAAAKGACQQVGNPLDSGPVQRALWEALDQWSTRGVVPPASSVPRLADGTLVPALPQAVQGFPKIPGVTYTGLKSTRYLLNYGPEYYKTGIATINPPAITPPMFDNPANGPIYPTFVPKTDADGNDIAGIRLPDVTAPLATYTGWSLRAGAQANDGCEGTGQMIGFPRTKAERMAAGDPRPSIEERYASADAYASAAKKAIDDLVARRLMLQEDVQPYVERMRRGWQSATTSGTR